MGKGEIAHYEQFLLFPQCFQKACFPEVSKGVTVWEWVKWQILDSSRIKDFADYNSKLDENGGKLSKRIHAIRPGLSGTVPDFDTLSQRPGNYEIVPEI